MRPDQTDPGYRASVRRADGWAPEASDPSAADIGDDGAELVDGESRAGVAVAGTGTGPWSEIKSRFVDDPLAAIAAAEEQVRLAIDDKIRALKAEAAEVCARDHDEEAASTEALRTRLIRYQAYCEQLASTAAH